jgi:hypothetical protein
MGSQGTPSLQECLKEESAELDCFASLGIDAAIQTVRS